MKVYIFQPMSTTQQTKSEFFDPNQFCFGKLSICQRECEDIKNGGTILFFFYNLMLRGYPKHMYYSMFQGSVGKE